MRKISNFIDKHPVWSVFIPYILFFLTGLIFRNGTDISMENALRHLDIIWRYMVPFLCLLVAILLLGLLMAKQQSVPSQIVLVIATSILIITYLLIIPWHIASPIISVSTIVIIPAFLYIYNYPKNHSEKNSGVCVSLSVVDELLKNQKLLDKGVLTQKEFDEQKTKLLTK